MFQLQGIRCCLATTRPLREMLYSALVKACETLHKALLTSNCQQVGDEVRTWLQNIEQDWAWEDSFARKILLEQQTDKVSWWKYFINIK